MRSIRILLFVTFLLVSSVAQATVVTYTSRATWEAASSGITNVDLESLGLSVGGFTNYSTTTGLTTGGLTFVGVLQSGQYFLYALNPPSGADEDFGSSTVLKGPEYRTTSYLSIALPASTSAFGLDLGTAFPAAQSFRIEIDGTDVGLLITTQARPTRTFFGVTSDSPFSEIRIRLDSGTLNNTQGIFDNFAYGEAASEETPEAATMITLGTGLLLLHRMHRRRRGTGPVCPEPLVA